jgi:hypothetical protein
MLRRPRLLAVLAVTLIAGGALAYAALGASGQGSVGSASFATGGRVDTPSGTFLNVRAPVAVTSVAGPLLVRFSATGYEQDFNRGGSFVGKRYAAMNVRVLVDGVQVGPAVRFFDNTGKIGVQKPRPTTTSYEWARHVGAGNHSVTVQFKNRTTWDSATILASTLAVQHG